MLTVTAASASASTDNMTEIAELVDYFYTRKSLFPESENVKN